jgi:hypothetical protein
MPFTLRWKEISTFRKFQKIAEPRLITGIAERAYLLFWNVPLTRRPSLDGAPSPFKRGIASKSDIILDSCIRIAG